ncbi:hypothetical protein BXT84_03840 [Sulfobacillus thermotolerans]|uniref:Uncharacterized protein n=1 Tax=Sulfobacillus thermotolerans TaxID=338644 RepID=A0ABN5GXB6_9FIRM|nr:hypothetical protein BXT84_03840 [Sulfobacillus thermotolerans]
MTKFLRSAMRVFTIVMLLISLAGCWDNRPVDERDLVFTLGLENGTPTMPLKMIFQFPTPPALIKYAAHSGISKMTPVADVSGLGRSVAQCFNDGQSQVSRDLYLGQIQLVEVSSQLKPQVMRHALISLTRIGTMDMTPFIFVTTEPLDLVMKAKTDQDQFPTLYYSALFSCKHCQTDNLGVKLWQFMEDAVTPGVDPHLPDVIVEPAKQQISVDQVALYRHFQFVTVLSPLETQDFGLLEGLANKVSLYLPRGHISLRSIHGNANLRTSVNHGIIHAVFRINLTSTLADTGQVIVTPAQNAQIATEASQQLANSCLSLLKYTQRMDLDPWGVGRMLSWQHPRTFAKFKHWHQEYPKVVMTVQVHLHVYRLGNIK